MEIEEEKVKRKEDVAVNQSVLLLLFTKMGALTVHVQSIVAR